MTLARHTLTQEGYYLAERAADSSLVDKCFAECGRFLTASEGIEKKWLHDSGKLKHLVNVHRHSAAFADLIRSDKVRELVEEVFGTKPVFVTHSKVSFRFAGIEQLWLPHQDTGYKLNPKSAGVTFTILLEDCDEENGALQVFPRSHLAGRRPHAIRFVPGEKDPQVVLKDPLPIEPKTIAAPKGSIMAMDLNMVHQSGRNRRGGFRAIFIFEVEPVRFLPLESDGRDALGFNLRSPGPIRRLLRPPFRGYLRFWDRKLRPVAKRVLYALNRPKRIPAPSPAHSIRR